jgi:hypothetical protein
MQSGQCPEFGARHLGDSLAIWHEFPNPPFRLEGEGPRSPRRRPDLAHCGLAGIGVGRDDQFVVAVTVFETLAILSWVWFKSLRSWTVTLLTQIC